MNNQVWGMLNAAEQELLRETDNAALAELDEDELDALHTRVRRARTKYMKLYRRRAAEQVADDRARARAHATHARNIVKAEAFEEALSRVSRHLARAAKATADELKAERLAAARGERGGAAARRSPSAKAGRGARGKGPAGPTPKRRTPISKRAAASSRSTTRRAQARRDGR